MNSIAANQPTPWQDLFQRLLAEFGRREDPEWDRTESRLSASVYHDPARYDAEMARLFRRLPMCLGPADQLRESGDVLARDVTGLPLLLARDSAGEVGVFLNACRHRGARLLAERDTVCQRSTLSCPYHGWTYDLNGSLVSVPRREAFPALDLAARGLRRLSSIVSHGLIWAILDPGRTNTPDMADYLGPLDGDLTELGVGTHRFFRQHAVRRATNWKLAVDAFLEVYHVKRLHAATLGKFFLDTKAVSDHVGPHQRMLAGRDSSAELHSLPPAEWNPQRHATLVHLVFPNSVFVYHPDYISHLGIFPEAPGETLFVHTMLTPEPPADAKARDHWDRSFDLIDRQVFNGEDLFICEQIQSALVTGIPDDFVLGRYEDNVRRFHETIETALV